MAIQIGPAANLVNLPDPSLVYETPRTRVRTAWTALSGAVRVQQTTTSTRRWVYKWNFPLTAAQYDTVRDVYEEVLGAFPYELHDPSFPDLPVPLVVPVGDLEGSVHREDTFTGVVLTLQEVG